jgi:RNA polymerase sigma factor (sigma-70 family)
VFDIASDNRTEEQADALMSLEKVSEYLKTLNPKQREIITLRIWEERSYKEIAEIVGGTEDSVKMAFSRSIRDVREHCGTAGLTLLYVFLAHAPTLPFGDIS